MTGVTQNPDIQHKSLFGLVVLKVAVLELDSGRQFPILLCPSQEIEERGFVQYTDICTLQVQVKRFPYFQLFC